MNKVIWIDLQETLMLAFEHTSLDWSEAGFEKLAELLETLKLLPDPSSFQQELADSIQCTSADPYEKPVGTQVRVGLRPHTLQ